MKTVYEVPIGWSSQGVDVRHKDWAIYAIRDGADSTYSKGELVATAPADATTALLELEEGTWWIRVLPRAADGSVPPIEAAALLVRRVDAGQVEEPLAPMNLSIGPAEPFGGSGLMDPLAGGDTAHRIQIIEGPDQYRGKLVAEYPARHGGADHANVALPHNLDVIPMVGRSEAAARTVSVRGLVPGHGPGLPALMLGGFRLPEMDDFGTRLIASIVATGSAFNRTRFPAASSSTSWEEDNTDGLRMREIPTTTAAAGTPWEEKAGLLKDCPTIARFLPKLVFESEQYDLGERMRGAVDIYDAIQRKSSAFPDKSTKRFKGLDKYPDENPKLTGLGETVHWLARFLRSDGKPCQPLRPRWWIKWDPTQSPITMEYVPYRPGMWAIDARYIRVKLEVEDPSGLWQMICPKIVANFRPRMQRQFGSDTVTGGVASKTVTLANDPLTTRTPFYNFMHVTITPKTGGRIFFLSAKANQATPPTFDVTHEDFTNNIPGTNGNFDYEVVGW